MSKSPKAPVPFGRSSDNLLKEAEARIAKLGFGSPAHYKWEPTGGIVLTPEEADRVIELLVGGSASWRSALDVLDGNV